MYWNTERLNSVFGIDGPEFIEITEEDCLPVRQNWRGRKGMHSPEGKQLIGEAAKIRAQKTWNIYFEDGTKTTIVNLEEYSREKGYDPDNVRKVGKLQPRGYIYRSYKGIIKIEDASAPSDYNPWKWRVTHSSGKTTDIFSLNKWSKKNGYNGGALCSIHKGRKEFHKDIIRVEKLTP